MKYAFEMDSGAVIRVRTKFRKDWFNPSKFDKGDTQTHGQDGDHILSLLSFIQIKESRLKINMTEDKTK
jgi:hypothetical protein